MFSIIKAASVSIYVGTSILLSAASAASQPEIGEYYPQCEYTPLDVVTVKQKVKYNDNLVLQDTLTDAARLLVAKLLNIASERNAQTVLIIDRKIDRKHGKLTNFREDYSYLSFTAELVTPCESVSSFAKKLTPYNKLGNKQHSVNIGTIKGWDDIEIKLDSTANQRKSPAVTDRTISSSTGLFGIALETPYSQVVEKLGTATFSMQFNDKQHVLAYGRDLWLTFRDKKLVHATNQNIWLSLEVVNMLDFDERFEKQDWLLEGKIKKNQLFEEAKQLIDNSGSKNELGTSHNRTTLHIHTENSRNSQTQEYTNKVTGFTLELSDLAVSTTPKLANTPRVNQVISTYIDETERGKVLIEELETLAIGRARIDTTSELLFYDDHLVIEAQSRSINKLHYIEKVFIKQNPAETVAWTFDQLSQGQNLEQVMQILGPDAFNFDDTVEVDGKNHIKKLFFEHINKQKKLIAAEISVY